MRERNLFGLSAARRQATAVVAALTAWVSTSHAEPPSFRPLGMCDAVAFEGRVLGVSPDGLHAVGYVVRAGEQEACLWTLAGGCTLLGDLPGGPLFSRATAVTSAPLTTIGFGYGSAAKPTAARSLNASPVTALPAPPGTFTQSFAASISVDASVIAGSVVRPGGASEAILWADGASEALGDLPGGPDDSAALGISSDASTVVGYGTSSLGREAVRWTRAGGFVSLGDLPGGPHYSEAAACSSDGSVIVGYGTTAAGTEAFRWSADAGVISLGDLPGGTVYSKALAVSADGTAIVGRAVTATGDTAFLWTANHGLTALAPWLVSQGVPNLTGWKLNVATGISADARTIVGYGTNPAGFDEGWVVTLPPPQCPADFNRDGFINGDDFDAFVAAFVDGDPAADFNADGFISGDDFDIFVSAFVSGC